MCERQPASSWVAPGHRSPAARLAKGVFWEKRLRPKLEAKLTKITLMHADYDDTPRLQHEGVDHLLAKEDPGINVKTRSHRYKGDDVVLQTKCGSSDGWIYKERTDLIVYCWESSNGRNLEDGLLLFPNGGFLAWLDTNKDRFEAKDLGRETCVIVPIEEIPDAYILTDFDPSFPEDVPHEELPSSTEPNQSQTTS